MSFKICLTNVESHDHVVCNIIITKLLSNTFYSTFHLIVACYGRPIELTGPEGTISINRTQYQNWMECNWTIRVDTTQVNSSIEMMANIMYIIIYIIAVIQHIAFYDCHYNVGNKIMLIILAIL